MALGATPRDVAALVVGGACAQMAVGLLAGVPLAVLAARALRSQLFGVSPFNAAALLVAAAVVGGCSLLASAFPAWRARAIAPMEVLNSE